MIVLLALFVAACFPPAYVLSIGAALWLVLRGDISGRTYEAYIAPLFAVREHCTPFDAVMNWYLTRACWDTSPPNP